MKKTTITPKTGVMRNLRPTDRVKSPKGSATRSTKKQP